MKVALLGLLQSGKSTILAGLSGKAIGAVGSTKIEEAIVSVPDVRLDWLTEYYRPKKTTYATIDCLDLPGFNFTDEHGRAGSRRLINKIRTVDMFVLVVRAFENPAVPPYRGSVNPARDLAELQTNCYLPTWSLLPRALKSSKSRSINPPKPRLMIRQSWFCKKNCSRQ